jgi:hypothetical protein
LLNGQQVHDLFSKPAGGTAPDGKRAKDQGEPDATNFPFLL